MTRPRALVACEFTGAVRDRLTAIGWDAWSCDLEPAETPGNHHQGDVRDLLEPDRWDLLIAHPPCTDLAVSGARWFKSKGRARQDTALELVRTLLTAPVPRIAVENPVSVISTRIRPPDQIIHPWQYGHGETKATCLWLHQLPHLVPTDVVAGRVPAIHHMAPSPTRGQDRSRTYPGIADAIANQWGRLPVLDTTGTLW